MKRKKYIRRTIKGKEFSERESQRKPSSIDAQGKEERRVMQCTLYKRKRSQAACKMNLQKVQQKRKVSKGK